MKLVRRKKRKYILVSTAYLRTISSDLEIDHQLGAANNNRGQKQRYIIFRTRLSQTEEGQQSYNALLMSSSVCGKRLEVAVRSTSRPSQRRD